jgi:hypothetical protein
MSMTLFLCTQWFPVILVYCRFSTYSYVLDSFLSYSCTVDLVYIPMCSVVTCHSKVHEYDRKPPSTYECVLNLQYTSMTGNHRAHRNMCYILVYSRFSTHSYVLDGYLSYSCTVDLVYIHMCSVDTCHTRVL